MKIYDERSNAVAPIVRSYDAEFKAEGSGLQPQNSFKVITESVPRTLTSVPQLTYPESLYVLDRSLDGYEHLYHKAGPFQVNSDMIGFTP